MSGVNRRAVRNANITARLIVRGASGLHRIVSRLRYGARRRWKNGFTVYSRQLINGKCGGLTSGCTLTPQAGDVREFREWTWPAAQVNRGPLATLTSDENEVLDKYLYE